MIGRSRNSLSLGVQRGYRLSNKLLCRSFSIRYCAASQTYSKGPLLATTTPTCHNNNNDKNSVQERGPETHGWNYRSRYSSYPICVTPSHHDDGDERRRNDVKGHREVLQEIASMQALDPSTSTPKERIRAAQLVLHSLVRELTSKGRSVRNFSSSKPDSTEEPPQPSTTTTAEAESTTTMQSDFAEYLKGGDGSDGSRNNASPFPMDDESIRLPSETPKLESVSDKYRYIRRKHLSTVEAARARTASNVRRALTGNMVICVAKLGAWISSGSSSMLSEFVHSVVDCGNQSLLLLGLRDSGNVADRRHPYGYGKSIYFWALVSALGTFFLGAGVSMTHSIGELMNPSLGPISWEVWAVLGVSLAVDGYVFGKTIMDVRETMPKNAVLWNHVWSLRDPATLAVLLEDGAACLGILIACAGISASHATGMPVFDSLTGCGISALLASMGIVLVRVNHRFLLGQAVDKDITEGIEKVLLNRRSIDNVQSVQSQWTGPETFSFKAEVDFDGTFLAAKLMPRYQKEFLEVGDSLESELRVLLSWYAEDVIRTAEREVKEIEVEIRRRYPGAEYIELEPMSKDSDRFAIDDGMTAQLRRIEVEALNRYLKSLYPKKTTPDTPPTTTTDSPEKDTKS